MVTIELNLRSRLHSVSFSPRHFPDSQSSLLRLLFCQSAPRARYEWLCKRLRDSIQTFFNLIPDNQSKHRRTSRIFVKESHTVNSMRHQNASWQRWCVIMTTLITFSTISGWFTCPFITPVYRACNVLYYHYCTTFTLTLLVLYRIGQHEVRLRVWILWLEKLAPQ